MKKRFSSLSWKLFLICFAFVLSSVTLVSALSYRYVEKEISANESYYIEQILSKVDQYLTLSFTSLQTVLFSMEALAKANPDLDEPFREQLIDLYEMNFDYVTNLYFIQDDYSIVGASPITRALDRPDPYRAEIYRASLDSPLHSVVSKPYKSTFSGWTVTLSRHVSGSNPPIVAAIDLDLNRIETSLLSITQLEAMNLALIDEDGQLVAGYRGSSEPSGANSELHVLQVAGMSGAQLLQSGNTTFSLR
ncbi:MAG: hypothetical protein K0Q59_1500, partial [Paenibacillus sp.]|nr:hypothetical protein [Paenibacillus sp.]